MNGGPSSARRMPQSAPQTSGMAITSLVLGIVSFFCWIVTGLPAILLGVIALRRIKRSQGQLTGDGLAIAGIVTGAVSSLVILPLMMALLLPAVQAAREAAQRSLSMNHMKEIGLALQIHHDSHKSLPAPGGPGSGSQLSWRVRILPDLEEGALYEQFHHDEPWDSPHNRALIAKMPEVFKNESGGLPEGKTNYLLVTGPSTAFPDGGATPRLAAFSDGTSNTILMVEADADQAVEWTKPDDWQLDPNNPTRGLGTLRHGGFLAAFADGHIEFVRDDRGPETIKAMMSPAGREVIQPEQP